MTVEELIQALYLAEPQQEVRVFRYDDFAVEESYYNEIDSVSLHPLGFVVII